MAPVDLASKLLRAAGSEHADCRGAHQRGEARSVRAPSGDRAQTAASTRRYRQGFRGRAREPRAIPNTRSPTRSGQSRRCFHRRRRRCGEIKPEHSTTQSSGAGPAHPARSSSRRGSVRRAPSPGAATGTAGAGAHFGHATTERSEVPSPVAPALAPAHASSQRSGMVVWGPITKS